MKKFEKFKNIFKILASVKLSTNVYVNVTNACFAEIAASNWSFSSDV